MKNTIFALATAPGRAAVAVLRLSGPGVRKALRLIGAGGLKPRRASLRTFIDADGQALDRGLAIWFPSPGSYTGDDCAELHVHGGVGVVDSVSDALRALGLRLAEPGEFTRRAVQNGKLDLGQAEAVGDLINAESRAQSRQAISQLNGALGGVYRAWRGQLIAILADLEAAVDFPDEELPLDVTNRSAGPLEGLLQELQTAITEGVRGLQVREGYRVGLVGAPNAGKSTLFNALLDRDAAIVASVAGTTRDTLEASLDLEGYKVLLCDMAGLGNPEDAIEAEGMRRAIAWAELADLRIWVVDHAGVGDEWRSGLGLIRANDLLVLHKSDRPASDVERVATEAAERLGLEKVYTNHLPGGSEAFRTWLSARILSDLRGSDFPATTRARHAVQLTQARDQVERALMVLARPELAAEDVRLAVRTLAQVTGAIGVDDVLDRVFSTFCIGK